MCFGWIRKYVHLPHRSLSSKPALRITCTWLDTDECGIPRMSANSQTHSARSITSRTTRQRVSSASARKNHTGFLVTGIIVMTIPVTSSGGLESPAINEILTKHARQTRPTGVKSAPGSPHSAVRSVTFVGGLAAAFPGVLSDTIAATCLPADYRQGNPPATLSNVVATGTLPDPGSEVDGTFHNPDHIVNPPLKNSGLRFRGALPQDFQHRHESGEGTKTVSEAFRKKQFPRNLNQTTPPTP